MFKGKCIIFSAPSGSGKTTLVKHVLNQKELNLSFSISGIVPRGKPSLAPQHRLVVPLQQQLVQAQVLVDVNLDVGIVAVEA